MRTSILITGLVVVVLWSSLVAGAAVFQADLTWDGEVLSAEVFTGPNGVGIRVLYEHRPALRVLADSQAQTLTVIDDLNQSYSMVSGRSAVALSFLFTLSRILGVDEEWLEEGPVKFFSSGEQRTFPPFGECIRLLINDELSGVYWSREISPALGSLVGDYVASLRSEGIHLPFWEEMASMPGFPVAIYQADQAIFRLFQVGEVEEDWETHFLFEQYTEEDWVDFLTPWK